MYQRLKKSPVVVLDIIMITKIKAHHIFWGIVEKFSNLLFGKE